MQKQVCGHKRGIYNISIGVVRLVQKPSVLFSQDTASPSQADDNVIIHPPTSKHVKDVDNKTAILETPIEETDLAISVDYLTKKQSLTLVSDNVIKIC